MAAQPIDSDIQALKGLQKLLCPAPPDGRPDDNDRFVKAHCARYLSNLLRELDGPEQNALEFMSWILGDEINSLIAVLEKGAGQPAKRKIKEFFEDERIDDAADFARAVMCALQVCSARVRKRLHAHCRVLLQKKEAELMKNNASCIAANVHTLTTIFNATEREAELCLFIFILGNFSKAGDYFESELSCLNFEGRKYLKWSLGITQAEFDALINGNLRKAGMLEYSCRNLSIADAVSNMLSSDSADFVIREFCELAPAETIPLEYHVIAQQHCSHILNLLRKKPHTSTHILLYGPPGTGKTSFARGIAAELDIPAYEIRRPNEQNDISCRRAALIACRNLTSTGDRGALIIVDEADTILTTDSDGFFFFFSRRSESRDKAWINYYMDQPGTRVIWIVNDASGIDPSVMRRFAFSAHFKNFKRAQRVRLWNTVLERRDASRLLTSEQITALASRHSVSAGVIDLAVEKAAEVAPDCAEGFHSAVCMAIEAHQRLMVEGCEPSRAEKTEKAYSLDGLNMTGDVQALMQQVEAYDTYLKNPDSDMNICMNILFYGPPGTGKSELARHISEHLGRELIVKRASDLISKWVGESEQNIARVFAEAEQSDAVLVIDEADSFIFSRDMAVHSWETLQVNEFLTQMERFRGILICTTNRMTGIDDASIRRFNRKIEFNFLTPQGAEIFYKKLCAPLTAWPLDTKSSERLRSIHGLAPGDFKTVRDRFCLLRADTITHEVLVAALEEEAVIKTANTGKKIIGFTAQGGEKSA
jgi:transitional endoplasmic reticulum ATPase